MKWISNPFKLLRESVVVKLWGTIILLVALVLLILGAFLLQYIDVSFEENAREIKVLFIITAVIGFLLSTIFAFFLSKKIQQPLLQLKDAAQSVAKGDYTLQLNINSVDEIGQLASSFNDMSSKLDTLISDLSQETNHLSSIIKSIGDAVITFDTKGEVMLSNPNGHLLLQNWNTMAELWDTDDEEQYTQIPAPLREQYGSVLHSGLEVTEKIHIQGGVWSVVFTPLVASGTIRGVVAVIRDVTEEYKLDKIRRDFLANISHEIRTPLQMIQGYSEAILDNIVQNEEEKKNLVQVINDEALRMGRLVNDFLDVARMEAGHMNISHGLVNINKLLERVQRKFMVYSKEQNVALSVSSEHDLTLQHADEDRLEQVLTNLVDNAFRHTSSGKNIYLSANEVEINHKQFIEIKVKDEGSGIPAEDVPYIFERFFKADKARTRNEANKGTGLGLAIVKQIIDQHQGNIVVDSYVNIGTTFTILLPVAIFESIK